MKELSSAHQDLRRIQIQYTVIFMGDRWRKKQLEDEVYIVCHVFRISLQTVHKEVLQPVQVQEWEHIFGYNSVRQT